MRLSARLRDRIWTACRPRPMVHLLWQPLFAFTPCRENPRRGIWANRRFKSWGGMPLRIWSPKWRHENNTDKLKLAANLSKKVQPPQTNRFGRWGHGAPLDALRNEQRSINGINEFHCRPGPSRRSAVGHRICTVGNGSAPPPVRNRYAIKTLYFSNNKPRPGWTVKKRWL